MEKCFVGLDVSKEETTICICNQSGDVLSTASAATDPDVIFGALREHAGSIQCVVLETGRMANWLYNDLSDRGFLLDEDTGIDGIVPWHPKTVTKR